MSEAPRQIALGDAFAVTSDARWMSKVLTVGACTLIPLVGIFQLLGYEERNYRHAQEGGEGLPDPKLGEDIVAGFMMWLKSIANMLPMLLVTLGCFFGCTFVPTLVVAGGASAAGVDQDNPLPAVVMMVSMLFSYAGLFVGSLLIGVLSLDFTRRLFNGESLPVLSPGASFRAIRRNMGPFLLTWFGSMGAGFVGSIGVIVCYVGMLATLPVSMVIRGRLLAQWDAVVKASEPGEEFGR